MDYNEIQRRNNIAEADGKLQRRIDEEKRLKDKKRAKERKLQNEIRRDQEYYREQQQREHDRRERIRKISKHADLALDYLRSTMHADRQSRIQKLNYKGTHKIIHHMNPKYSGDWLGGEESKANSRIIKWQDEVFAFKRPYWVVYIDRDSETHNNNNPLIELRTLKMKRSMFNEKTIETKEQIILSGLHYADYYLDHGWPNFTKCYSFYDKIIDGNYSCYLFCLVEENQANVNVAPKLVSLNQTDTGTGANAGTSAGAVKRVGDVVTAVYDHEVSSDVRMVYLYYCICNAIIYIFSSLFM